MKKLNLYFNKLIQGDFILRKINFLFVFQVNCPGCFIYGIPIANRLYEDFKNQIGFISISTAFEDFEYNTEENTKLLLNQGTLVGETKKALSGHGFEELPYPIKFPVAFDKFSDNSFDLKDIALKICQLHPEYTIWPEFEQIALHKKVYQYLNNLDSIALTFTVNQFKGTPTMVVFNDSYEILDSKFGHTDYNDIKSKLESLILQFNK